MNEGVLFDNERRNCKIDLPVRMLLLFGDNSTMEEVIRNLIGKKIDVSCGTTAVFRGEVLNVQDGVLYLQDDDKTPAYIAIDKIATVYECSEHATRPGFLG